MSYENELCEAIETIVNNAVAKANYDKTIQATIISCADQTIGKFKCKRSAGNKTCRKRFQGVEARRGVQTNNVFRYKSS